MALSVAWMCSTPPSVKASRESQQESQGIPDARRRFKANAVDVCSHADAVVYEVSPAKGYATAITVGRC
jgi:hypothetical protein